MASKTQPIPLAPEPYSRQLLTADMLTTRTPEAHRWAVEQFKSFRSERLFIPVSVDTQTIILPGFDGSEAWGGPAIDPRSGTIYINANDLAWSGGLTENKVDASPGVTAGGLLFIGATVFDCKLRAFDPKTGKLLWQGDLPFAGTATPGAYLIDGKQYIVIATSGSRNPKGPQGAAYVASPLP